MDRSRVIWLPLVFIAGAMIAVPWVDVPLTCWVAQHRLPGDFGELMHVAETFGHGIGVVLILGLLWTLQVCPRMELLRLLVASVGAGLAADVVKLAIARQRPRGLEAAIQDGWSTFAEFLPLFDSTSTTQSFPSAHSATAVGLAVGLTVLFPRGKWYFTCLAALTCLSRIHVGAHYASDVLCGAAFGIVVAHWAMTRWQPDECARLIKFQTVPEENTIPLRKAA